MKMYIYSVDYWVSFPSSEYGGIFVVLAEDDARCIELLKDNCNYPRLSPERKAQSIAEAVADADKFLVETDREADVINALLNWEK